MAVIFALAALPLLALTSAAIDYSQVTKERSAISSALDAAVLAAANNNAISNSEKDAYAETHFLANYSGDIPLTLTPSMESDRVRLSAEGELELSFGNLVGIQNPTMREVSAATIANENTICLMALNESASESILFDGGISYSSPTCAVQANSSHEAALTSRSAQPPIAQSFCTVGGATGEFAPYVKGECKAVQDPYSNVALPIIPDTCSTRLSELIVFKEEVSQEVIQQMQRELFQQRLSFAFSAFEQTGSLSAGIEAFFSYETDPIYDTDLNANIEVSQNRTGSDVDVLPGTFCGGLTIDGINVDFLPGEYIIKDGPLSFINGAEAVAEDVTFILSGSGAVLNIQSQSSLNLKAPSQGSRKGLAVMEAIDASAPGNRTIEEKSSLIAEGGSLQVFGTVYLPQQTLEIMGQNTSIGSMAPSTSFIADKLHISGGYGSKMVIGVDHVEADMPPILPRAEDGARLVE
ncbi:MAG: pilus assembly protein TadG-related protein [Litorimonas sp.]